MSLCWNTVNIIIPCELREARGINPVTSFAMGEKLDLTIFIAFGGFSVK